MSDGQTFYPAPEESSTTRPAGGQAHFEAPNVQDTLAAISHATKTEQPPAPACCGHLYCRSKRTSTNPRPTNNPHCYTCSLCLNCLNYVGCPHDNETHDPTAHQIGARP